MDRLNKWYVSDEKKLGIVNFDGSKWSSVQEANKTIRVHYRKNATEVTDLSTPLEVGSRWHSGILHGVITNIAEIIDKDPGRSRGLFEKAKKGCEARCRNGRSRSEDAR